MAKKDDDKPLSAAEQIARQTGASPHAAPSPLSPEYQQPRRPEPAKPASAAPAPPLPPTPPTPTPPAPTPPAPPAGASQTIGELYGTPGGTGGTGAPAPPPPPPVVDPGATSKNWMGITGLVVSLLCGVGLGLVFGILGLRAAAQGEANNRSVSLAAVILSALQLVFTLIVIIALFADASSGSSAPSNNSGGSGGNSVEELLDGIEQSPGTDASPAAPPAGGDYVEADLLALGDCYLEIAPGDTKFKVTDCASPHWGEVYHVGEVAVEAWPGADAMDDAVDAMCQDAQVATLGETAYSDYYGFWIYSPTVESFKFGDREGWCIIASPRGSVHTGSLMVGTA